MVNSIWVSMVNAAWFGAYGHGEGPHLLGYPAEIDWNTVETDFQKCRENFVQVVRAFIFENLDGCLKIGSVWDVAPETLYNLDRLKQLLIRCLGARHDPVQQLYLRHVQSNPRLFDERRSE